MLHQANQQRYSRDSAELWFEFDKSIEPPSVDDCDAYLLAVIIDEMKHLSKAEKVFKGFMALQKNGLI
ncbi:MAG TPA: hypothetical protein PK002_01425 [Cellvibrio sp.]|nr:hypothetical protein [Cellvibrio sp.]